MTPTHYPVVFERESSGTVSAYVVGLPVYAAADTVMKVERAIRAMLAGYLLTHPHTVPTATLRIARVANTSTVEVVEIADLSRGRPVAAKRPAQRAGGRSRRPLRRRSTD
jgi:hypothetical protein